VIALATALLLSANLIDERRCAGKVPERATLAQLVENVDAWVGRCVTVKGKSLAGSLVEGDDRQIDGMPRLRLGIYERDGVSARSAILAGGGEWEVTGAIDSCKRIGAQVRAQHEAAVITAKAAGKMLPSPPMLWGACHYQSGPVVWIASYRRPNNSE
jgi:hypothetical protein